jgi:predicted metal-binding membrane protein
MKSDRRFIAQKESTRCVDCFPRLAEAARIGPADLMSEQAMSALTFVVCGISLLTAPVDLILSPSYSWLCLAVLAKCAFTLIGLFAINYGRLAYPAFAFGCCLGIFCVGCCSLDLASRSTLEIAATATDSAVKLLFVLVFLRTSLPGRRFRRDSSNYSSDGS